MLSNFSNKKTPVLGHSPSTLSYANRSQPSPHGTPRSLRGIKYSQNPSRRNSKVANLSLENTSITPKAELFYQPPAELHHWTEIRTTGKKLERRCYHSAVIYNEYLYIYGGYEYNSGILQDFYKIRLGNANTPYDCQKIVYAQPELQHADSVEDELARFEKPTRLIKLPKIIHPGPRARHTAVVYQDKMYLFGGQKNCEENCSTMHAFDFSRSTWELVEYTGTVEPSELDSQTANLWEVPSEEGDPKVYMIVFGGFIGGKIGDYTNQVMKYDFQEKSWEVLFANQPDAHPSYPYKRMGHGAAIIKDSLYIFGGTDSDLRFGDLWTFDLVNKAWKQIVVEGLAPEPRNGLKLVPYQNKVVLFGGIHELTHEKNDLYVFDPVETKWTLIEDETKLVSPNQTLDVLDSKRGHSKSLSVPNMRKNLLESPNKSKLQPSHQAQIFNFEKGADTLSMLEKQPLDYSIHDNNSILKESLILNKSTKNKMGKEFQKLKLIPIKPKDSMLDQSMAMKNTSNLQERRIRDQLVKKNMILQDLQVPDHERYKYFDKDPITDQMKKSLQSVESVQIGLEGRELDRHRLSAEFVKKGLLIQIPDGVGRIIGSKPRARDGHSCSLNGDYLVIFGGDRHKMCFNDMFLLDLGAFGKYF